MLFPSGGKIHDTTHYLEEVLSTLYPMSITLENLEVYNLANFSKDIQHEYRDGATARGTIFYHSGNVTGFQDIQLRLCNEPSWKYDNLILNCSIVFPQITVRYSINAQLSISNTDWDMKQHKRDFGFKCDIIYMEARLEVLISARFPLPLLKSVPVINDGKQVCYVSDTEVPEEAIYLNIAHKFNDTLRDIFYDVYKVHFAIALGSAPYALNRLKPELGNYPYLTHLF